ncbi:MAG: hypothetical protein GC162_01360 [Planctomycetes bacterium]|nr:hypothetical protein [Planctomycetota bacterium]
MSALRAVVLMAGSVRPSKLDESIGRSIMELPMGDGETIIGHWHRHTTDLAHCLTRDRLPVQVMLDHSSTMPKPMTVNGAAQFSIERDPMDYRGTGGVLRDLSEHYEPDDYLLVANGLQVMFRPLSEMALLLASRGAHVCIVAHEDGTPSGLMLVQCQVLEKISRAGFVDMKEQALPAIARDFRVGVVELDQPCGLPVRTLADYMSALRLRHLQLANKPVVNDPFAENIESTFSVIEDGAEVDSSARIHDSVVLAGSRVDAGAIVVRSLVCPGAVVGRNQRVIDRLMAAPRRLRERGVQTS